MLTISKLGKVFGTMTAVEDISITVPEPTMIGIVGSSGAGKSTLLRMLNRLTDVTSGSIVFEGEEITNPVSYTHLTLPTTAIV